MGISSLGKIFGVNGSYSGSVSGNAEGSGFINSIFTRGDNTTEKPSDKAKQKGIRALIKAAWNFIKSVVTPNKSAKASQQAASHEAQAVELMTGTTTQLEDLMSKAAELSDGILSDSSVLQDLIKSMVTLSEEVQALQEQLETLQKEAEAKRSAIENADDPDKKEELAEELQEIVGNIDGISSRLTEIQASLSDMGTQIEELQENMEKQTEDTEEMVEENTEKIAEQTENNAEFTAEGTETSAEAVKDNTSGGAGEVIATDLKIVAAGATATVVGSGVGVEAEVAAEKTGHKSTDLLGAGGFEAADAIKIAAEVVKIGAQIAANSGQLDEKQTYMAGIISDNANYIGSLTTSNSEVSSAIDNCSAMITSVGSMFAQSNQYNTQYGQNNKYMYKQTFGV